LSRVIPDITFDGSVREDPSVTLTMSASDYPGASYGQTNDEAILRTSTAPVEQYTKELYFRLRGRQLKMRLDSDKTEMKWRLGSPRADLRTDGKR